jgi:anoctamin-10
MGQEEAEKAAAGGIAAGQKISRRTLEEAARESTLRGHGTPEERFWQRQQGQDETSAMGRKYIQKVCLVCCSDGVGD